MRAALSHTWPAALLALAASVACSKSPPANAPQASEGMSQEAAEEEPPMELTPVAPPENLVGVATLRTPARTLDTAFAWTELGLDFRTVLGSGPLATLLPALDLDAPLDVVVTVDPSVHNRPRAVYAASIGLSSKRRALDAFAELEYPVEQVEPGVHGVSPNPSTFCFIAPALGQARWRLVCGEDRASVELLSPYLTRGTPSAGTGEADLHIDLRAEAPWRLYGEKAQLLQLGVPMLLGELSTGNPDFDGALRDGATALVDELILGLGELKTLRLDAWLRGEPGASQGGELEVDLAVAFNSARSWLARALADGEARASTAPDTFWSLPADATQAAYYSTSNPALTENATRLLERLFESGLGHLEASPAVRRGWPEAFRRAMEVKGPIVSARGEVPADVLPASLDAREELRASIGYTIVGVEDPDDRYGAWLERTLALHEDAALRKSLSQKYGLDPAKLPKAQNRKGPARLPGSRVYELALPAALFADALKDEEVNAASLAPIPLALVSSRQGAHTWFAVSSYAKVAEQKLLAVVAGGPPEATLAQRPGLDRLRSDRSSAAGFWTLEALAETPSLGRELGPVLARLQDNDVPVVGRAQGFSAGPSGLLELRVPARLFRDVAFAATGRTEPPPAPPAP